MGFAIIVGFIALVILSILSLEKIQASARARTTKKDTALNVNQGKPAAAKEATLATESFLAQPLATYPSRRPKKGDEESTIIEHHGENGATVAIKPIVIDGEMLDNIPLDTLG